ncbi:MAG: hypothetical protein GF399_09900 [Candidatus Coatesbacteria bacterium]|nr:hypothetical protein [Candidatus Coatesbacteria bacterium]
MDRLMLIIIVLLAALPLVGCEENPQNIAPPSDQPPLVEPPPIVLLDREAEYVLAWTVEGVPALRDEALTAAREVLANFEYPVPEGADAEPEIGLETTGGVRFVYPANPARAPEEGYSFNICFPIEEDSPVPEGFKVRELPGGRAARLVQNGADDPDYAALYDFCAANDLTAGELIVIPATGEDDEETTVELFLHVVEEADDAAQTADEAADASAADTGGEQ